MKQYKIDDYYSALSEQLLSGMPIDLSQLSRQDRLAEINALLEHLKLAKIESLGISESGQTEITGLNSLYIDPFITRIDFQCRNLTQEFNHLCYFSSDSHECKGVVIVPIINQEWILMVKQFRPTIGKAILELPRGFPNAKASKFSIHSYGNAVNELREETGINLDDHRSFPKFIQYIHENTGTSNITNAIYKLELKVAEQDLNSLVKEMHFDQGETSQIIKTQLVNIKKLGDVVEDQHTAASLWLVLNAS